LSAVAVLAAGALVAPSALRGIRTDGVGATESAGLPDDLTVPPWWTETVARSPAGPASVVFSGEDAVPQADHEDYDVSWWRPDYTVYPSVAVGLYTDSYRIVRGPYTVGTELSPDGRYLLTHERRVIDLTTGRSRGFGTAESGSYTDVAWSTDGTRILVVEDTVTTVLSWPSLTEQARFSHPEHRPVARDLALSPDGSMLAVDSNEALSVYRAGGTRLWTWTEAESTTNVTHQPRLGRLRLAGRAAWHADGRLAIFGRTDLRCDDCGVHPGTWELMFLEPPQNLAGPGLPGGPSYPILKNALDVRIVAWREETAYAVVTYSRDGTDNAGRIELIRLRTGQGAYDHVLTAPAGADSMQVATEFVDTWRPTGGPDHGFNHLEVVGEAVNGFLCFSPFVLVIVVLVLIRRRARRSSR
jgi:hypothetical protein